MDVDNPTILARAPAYALESDGSDSDWDEEMAATAPRVKRTAPDAQVELVGTVASGREVVFLIGEAGERLAVGVKVEAQAVQVLVDGEQVSLVPSVPHTRRGRVSSPSRGPPGRCHSL